MQPPIYQSHYVVHENSIPTGLILFIVGLFVAPAWWVGACYPPPVTKDDFTWRKVNQVMTCVSVCGIVLLVVAWIVIVALALASGGTIVKVGEGMQQTTMWPSPTTRPF